MHVPSLLGQVPGGKSGLLGLALPLIPHAKEKHGQVVA